MAFEINGDLPYLGPNDDGFMGGLLSPPMVDTDNKLPKFNDSPFKQYRTPDDQFMMLPSDLSQLDPTSRIQRPQASIPHDIYTSPEHSRHPYPSYQPTSPMPSHPHEQASFRNIPPSQRRTQSFRHSKPRGAGFIGVTSHPRNEPHHFKHARDKNKDKHTLPHLPSLPDRSTFQHPPAPLPHPVPLAPLHYAHFPPFGPGVYFDPSGYQKPIIPMHKQSVHKIGKDAKKQKAGIDIDDFIDFQMKQHESPLGSTKRNDADDDDALQGSSTIDKHDKKNDSTTTDDDNNHEQNDDVDVDVDKRDADRCKDSDSSSSSLGKKRSFDEMDDLSSDDATLVGGTSLSSRGSSTCMGGVNKLYDNDGIALQSREHNDEKILENDDDDDDDDDGNDDDVYYSLEEDNAEAIIPVEVPSKRNKEHCESCHLNKNIMKRLNIKISGLETVLSQLRNDLHLKEQIQGNHITHLKQLHNSRNDQFHHILMNQNRELTQRLNTMESNNSKINDSLSQILSHLTTTTTTSNGTATSTAKRSKGSLHVPQTQQNLTRFQHVYEAKINAMTHNLDKLTNTMHLLISSIFPNIDDQEDEVLTDEIRGVFQVMKDMQEYNVVHNSI